MDAPAAPALRLSGPVALAHRILAVAVNGYRESVRARILLGLAGVAFAAALYALVVGAFTLSEAPRVVADLGAAAVSIFSVAVAIFIGASSLHRELEQKTILPMLARPIRRAEYLLGKYAGILLVVTVFVLAEGGLVLMMAAVLGGRSLALVLGIGVGLAALLALGAARSPWARTFGPIPWAVAMLVAGTLLASVAPAERSLVLASAALTLLEVAIVAAVAMLFSSFSTPFLSAVLTLGMFVVGRSADALVRLPKKYFGPAIHEAGKILAKLVPNLHVYVPARPLLTGEALDASLGAYLAMAALQSLGWVALLLAVAALVFQRRDFL
jgi:ABC-type transport system involved in multi-copper enzyme maturation permease subunit